MAVICGSRAHLEEQALAKRHPLRNLLMYGFKLFVWLVCVRGVRDTQCGFKLFSRPAARLLFHNLHVDRWAFDVDLLYLARHFDMNIVEIPVHWQEIPGNICTVMYSFVSFTVFSPVQLIPKGKVYVFLRISIIYLFEHISTGTREHHIHMRRTNLI